MNEINERIKSLSVKMARKQSVREEERIPLDDQRFKEVKTSQDLSAVPKHLPDDQFSLGDELNNRIQEILQHLQTQTTVTER